MERLGVVAIVVASGRDSALKVQSILTEKSDVIVARMGIPDRTNNESVIALIVRGTVEKISSLTGALGRLNGVQAKSMLTSAE